MSETAGDSQSGRKSRGIKVQSDLFCKSGCGFYGNSNWQGYCSKCWKEKLVKQNHENAHHSLQHHSDSHQVKSAKGYFSRGSEERSTFPRRLRTRTAEEPAKLPGNQSPSKTGTFSRFEEKRIQHHDKRTRTVKSLFKKNSVPAAKDFSSVPYLEDMLEGASSATASLAAVFQGLPSAGSSSGSNTSSDAFTEFLKTLSKPVAVDISRHIASFTQRMLGMCEEGASIDELSDTAKEFYQNLSDRLRNHPTFGDATTEQLEAMMDFTEKTLMTKLYKSVFFALSAHNEDRDLAIQKRIRSLNWVSASHLDCCIDESRPEVRELIDQAITYAIEIDSRRAPQDKLSCIVKCSKKIFELLRVSRGFSGQTEAASADEFLPALIFVVLRANPPLLHSNISYIDKFCNPGRLLSGEAGYYFTNLCCAVEFIEKLDHDSLNLTKDEFDRFMSGEALPPSVAYAFGAFGSAGGGVDAIDTPWLCEGVRIMKGNLVALGQLSERERKLREENEKLLRDGREFVEKIKKEVDEVLKRTPLSSQPHKSPAKLDESSEEQNLPPPMIPEVVGCISPIPAQETSTASGVANVTDFLEELELGQEVSEDCDDQILDLTVPENHDVEEEKAEEKAAASEEPKFVDALDCVEEKVIEEKKEATPKPKPRRPMPEYTGFSRQGESIPTIPCDTGSVHSSPVRSSASPTGGERVVSVLSGILRIADAF